MFLHHFQFTTQPFAERVAAESLWQDDRMQQGLARLRYLAEEATVALVSVRFHLSPLSKEQTAAYIDFQVKQAGGSEKLFDATAKSLIHDYSGGVPRQINNLATASLLSAASQKAARINEAILQQTLNEFQLP